MRWIYWCAAVKTTAFCMISVACSLLGSANLRAEPAVPSVAKDLLTYCTKNAKDCDKYISSIEFAFLASSSVTGINYCGPEASTSDLGRTVLRQLAKAAPKTLRGPTDDGIRSSLTALYPCKSGVRSVADFLKACDGSASQCSTDIDAVSDVLQFVKHDSNFCPPDPDKMSDKDVIANWASINTWLRAHSGLRNSSRAIADAWRARYPCPAR